MASCFYQTNDDLVEVDDSSFGVLQYINCKTYKRAEK